jgi:signal transduction histidine kinase
MPKKQLLLTTCLIVVPALALALLSLLSVRSQREGTERERERLADKLGKGILEQFNRSFSEVESLADAASSGLLRTPPGTDALSAMVALPHVEALFILGGDGALLAPVPPWRTHSQAELDPDFRAVFDAAEALEISGKTQEAATRYEALLKEATNGRPQALLLNALARCHRKTGRLADASELYKRVLNSHPAEFSISGTSLAGVAALESMAAERELNQPGRALEICRGFLEDVLDGRIHSSRDEAAYYAAEVAALLKEPLPAEEKTRGACERALALLRNVLAAERAAELLGKDPAPQNAVSRNYTYRAPAPDTLLGIKGLDAEGRRVAFCLRTEAFKGESRRAIERLLQYTGNFDYEIRDARQMAWIAAKNGPLTPPVVRFSPERLPGWELAVTVPESQAMQSGARLRMLAASGLILLLLLTIGASLYFMNAMVRRTAELSALKTDFVSAVSHEMRTPLATIRMIAEMFQMQRVKDLRTSQEYIDTVAGETERLTRLINKVLDFSRMDSGRQPYSFVPTAPGPLVEATVKNFEAGVSRNCRINVVIEEDLPEVAVDEDAIVQALINLLDNAVKYSPEPGQVQVTLSRRGGELLLQVADRGVGIDPRKLGMIFEKFYRCEDELTRQTTGTGIGLSIVKHIAEAHNGRIEVRSVPGQGSVFTLHLPLPASISLNSP